VLTGAGFSVDAGLPVTDGLIPRGRQWLKPERKAEFEDILDACTVGFQGKPLWKKDKAIAAVLTRLTVLKMDSSDFMSSPGDPSKEYDYLKQIFPVEHGIYFLIWLALLPAPNPPSLGEYDALLAHLGNDVAFATLNYDLLLETIFRRNQRVWYYPLQDVKKCPNELGYGDPFYASLEDDPHSIPYLKLHGSFNWHYCWRCDYLRIVRDEWYGSSGFHLSAPGYTPLWVTSRGTLACDEDNCAIDSGPGVGQGSLTRHIIPPTRIKDYSRTPISWQWLYFDALVRQAEQLIIVGTSLRNKDIPLFMTLQYLRRKSSQLTRQIVTNPDPEAASKAEMRTEVKPTGPSVGICGCHKASVISSRPSAE
jgi:hypothetical protein